MMKIKLTKNSGGITAIILFAFFSFLYIHTAAPSVYVGDSGELAAGIKNLEIVHPTGFPLYLITANIFAKFLPFDEFAFRLNAYSAFLTAASLVFVFFSIKSLGISYLASFFTVSILGLGKTIWFHSGTIGVYPLSLFLSSVSLLIFSKWLNTKKLTLVFWYAFVSGVSFGTHVLMITMFIPFGYMLWINRHEIMRSGGTMAKIAFLFCAPFIQYIYLFIARTRQETITTFKIDGFRELFNYLRQKEYVYKIGARTLANTGNFIKQSASLFVSEFTLVFFILAIIGLVYLYKKNRSLVVLTLGIISINVGIMYLYGNSGDTEILYRYYFISYLILTISIACALNYIFHKTKNGSRVIIFFALGTALFLEFWFSYTQNNRRNNYLVPDFANNILLTAETNAIILSVGDTITGPLWYLQSVGVRPDVKVVDLNLLSDDAYILNWSNKDLNLMDEDLVNLKGEERVKLRLLALLNKNIDKYKIYVLSNPSDKDIIKNFEFLPVGVVNQVFRKNKISINEFKTLYSNNWQKYTMRGVKSGVYKDSFLDQIAQIYSIMLSNSGVIYFNAGLLDDAKLAFEKSIGINPQNTAAQDGLKIINAK